MKKNLLGISLLTITGLYFLLSAIIILVCLVTNASILIGLSISIVILIIQFLIAPWLTDLTMRWFYKVNFDYQVPEYLSQFIDEVCSKHNMKRPRIGFIDDGSPNAFTYGRTKNDARVVFTRGCLELLDVEEQKTVIAHELGHAIHYDMLFMTVAQLVPLILYFIYEVLAKDNSSRDSDDSKTAIVGYIAYVLYLISELVILWLSRTREYYADEFSVEATGNPNALASALVKIGFGLITNKDQNTEGKTNKHSTQNLGALGLFDSKTSKSLIVMTNNNQEDKTQIKNAMKWEMWNPWAFFCELKSTHPLISKRLIAISAHSAAYGQEPYITFDLQKPESYVDDFAIELLISALPLIAILIGVVLFFLFGDATNVLAIIGITGLLFTAGLYVGFKRAHRKGYQRTTVANLLSEVKVSNVTSISCELEGEIIGRGNPGYIFNEDFMIKDETGIIFADYNSPLWIINKVFALFKNGQNAGKIVKIKGWYRRNPVPYVEIFSYEIDGKEHKMGIYTTGIVVMIIFLILSILALVYGLTLL